MVEKKKSGFRGFDFNKKNLKNLFCYHLLHKPLNTSDKVWHNPLNTIDNQRGVQQLIWAFPGARFSGTFLYS